MTSNTCFCLNATMLYSISMMDECSSVESNFYFPLNIFNPFTTFIIKPEFGWFLHDGWIDCSIRFIIFLKLEQQIEVVQVN